MTDASLRVGLISLAGVLLTLAPATLMGQAGWTVALLVPAVFFIGLPIGCGYAAVQLIFPNQARGLVSAIVIFAVAMIGLNFGSLLPGLLDDRLFHDPDKIGWSMSLTVALAGVLGLVAAAFRWRRTARTIVRRSPLQPCAQTGSCGRADCSERPWPPVRPTAR